MSSPRGRSDLAAAWLRLDARGVARLLARHVDPHWREKGGRITGPCPLGIGNCAGDDKAAFGYPSQNGAPPMICCGHLKTCGGRWSAFDLLAEALGRSRAAAVVLDAATAVVQHGGNERR